MSDSSISRYWHTIRHLGPAQLAHRVRLRTQRALYNRVPSTTNRWANGIPADGAWPSEFLPIDRAVAHSGMAAGPNGRTVFRLLGEEVDVAEHGWRPEDRTQLFRYHLHYFEWAWPMAAAGTDADREQFALLWNSWQADTVAGRWDEWSPYVVSLRAWVLCGVFDDLIRDTSIEASVIQHQRMALGFLDRNLELDVGGNHLIKNLKAIVGLAVFFGDDERFARALQRLDDQLEVQILGDGGHFELSPAYHAQVMADIADITNLCAASDTATPFDGQAVIERMRRWLDTMSYPDGSLPTLGDCTPPPDGLLAALRLGPESATPAPLTVLTDTGYVAARLDDAMVVADFGPPCPPELPAHAQADWGTFELWVGGLRVICDPGVSTYVGTDRARERSTAAHNTVTVAGRNQTDVWSSFRAGKRAIPSPILATETDAAIVFESSLLDIHGICHHRRFELTADELRIEDSIEPSAEPAVSVLTLALNVDSSAFIAANRTATSDTTVAPGFGVAAPARRLEQDLVDGRASWAIPLPPSMIDPVANDG